MRRGDTEELMALLAGELPAERAAALSARLLREPELAAALRRLETAWRSVEPPPAGAVPPGFAREVMARVEREAEGPAALSWSLAPVWVRAAGAAALAAGVLLGAGAGALREGMAHGGGGDDRGASGIETRAGGEGVGGETPDGEGRAGAQEAPGLLAPSLAEEYLEAVGGEGEGTVDPFADWSAS